MDLKKSLSLLLCNAMILGVFFVVAYFGSEATSVVAQMIPLERNYTVVIDAGHGGTDGGAVSCAGIKESSYNLDIAIRLNDLFHLLGIHTKMIRTTDISVYTEGTSIAEKKISDLNNRIHIVNTTENPVLISIHQNTFSDSQYSGAQVFYSASGEGESLAKSLQKELIQSINKNSKRQIKSGKGIYLLENILSTGILVECGFISNPEEEAKLRSEQYQKMLCCVIASAVSNHLDASCHH